MRPLLAITGVLVFAAIATMASVAQSGVAAPPAPPEQPEATAAVLEWPTAAPTDQPIRSHPRMLSGFIVPIAGAEVPTNAENLPNAPREYRAGYHEGIDFPANAGTPVRAAKAGTIARIDAAYQEWSLPEQLAALDAAHRLGHTPEATLDRLRGRQVWIDHGGGIVTRYAHLSAVAPLRVGDLVAQGQVIATAGSSGYPEGGPHLHFEIRVGDDYYGDGLPLAELRRAISAAFR